MTTIYVGHLKIEIYHIENQDLKGVLKKFKGKETTLEDKQVSNTGIKRDVITRINIVEKILRTDV